MLIGIKLTKAKSGPPLPSIFYCGLDGGELRAAHAKALETNEDGSRFYQCHNPMMIPLQSVPANTEDHPDQIAAQQRRQALAKKTAAAASEVIRVPVIEGSGPETSAPIIPIPVAEPGSAIAPVSELPATEGSDLEVITPEARKAELAVLKHADLRGIAEGIKNSGRPIALTVGTKAQLIEAILASEISTSGSDCPPPGAPPAAE